MPKKAKNDLVVGLDIGTSKILAIVAETNRDGNLEVIGLGHHTSRGLRKGVVANIESTVNSMQRAIEEAELMAGCQIYSVHVGIAGAHISSYNSHGVARVPDGEVSQSDVDRVIDAAKAMAIPTDQRILHVLPQDYVIDTQDGIREPVGMSGVRLEAHVHIITSAISATKNIIKCVHRCGLEVDDLILEQLASSQSVLTDDERELGVCMIDIGGGTTDIAVFADGVLRHTAVIPIAGDQVTDNIAVKFSTPTQHAEEIKKKHGYSLAQMVDEGQYIETPSMGDRPPRKLSKQELAGVIEPCLGELLTAVRNELEREGFYEIIRSGVVMTGGCSRTKGMVELAENIFGKPVRMGMPRYDGRLCEVICNPIYSTGIGLVLFGHTNHHRLTQLSPFTPNRMKSVTQRVKNWFRGSF